ncbi:MAG TPA: DUF4231 domain-containing protein [Pyrinomonadaceae bacterium]|jgi:predicted Rossmann-fold nucleotide-binding protein
MATNAIKKQAILFRNQNQAVAVFPSAQDKAEEIVAALEIKPYQAVILILGGASSIDESLIPRLTQLFGRGIARAAAEANAVIIDGGTDAGVMALMGQGVAGRGYKSTLIGVAPAAQVTYAGVNGTGAALEPNHSHFVLMSGDGWGSEAATTYSLAGVLSGGGAPAAQGNAASTTTTARASEKGASKFPCLAILAGGGPIARDEALRAVRRNLPLIVVEGSGGLADEIAAAWKQKETLPDDPLMAEIIADGDIHIHLLSSPVESMERLIIRELGVDNVLMHAWEFFADYDMNANFQQRRFNRLQLSILIVGLIGTALAIIQQVYAPKAANGSLQSSLTRDANGNLVLDGMVAWWVVHQLLIITPILLTVLITAANRFKQGTKWLLLRAGAESIKREIYRYRTRAMYYKENSEHHLSERVEDITRRTMRTEVNLSALIPYNKDKGFPPYMYAAQGGDDGFSYLTPDRYVEVRLGDQLNYFKKKAVQLDKQMKALYWLTFIIGGVGTYLAAVNQQVWIALTTAIVAAIGTYLGFRQTESTLTKYNQAATDLANVKAWWNALSAEEQSQQQNIDSLVEHTEQVLQSELDGWVQQMQNALAELRKTQEPSTERNEGRDPNARAASKDQTKEAKEQPVAGGPQPGVKPNGDAARTAKTGPDPQKIVEGGKQSPPHLNPDQQPSAVGVATGMEKEEEEAAGVDVGTEASTPIKGNGDNKS